MLRRSFSVGAIAAVVAAGAPAPPAAASDAGFGCYVGTVRTKSVTGSRFDGVAYGFVVSPSGGNVAISCVVTVGGAVAAQTGQQAGTGSAVTAGVVSFDATPTDDVDVCAVVTDHGATTTRCHQVTSRILPGAAADTIDQLLAQTWLLWPGPLCWLLSTISGEYGPVHVNVQGDVYVDGEPFFDCPPYDIEWPSNGRYTVEWLGRGPV